MWTYKFWTDTSERVIRAAAVSLVTLWAGSGPLDFFHADWQHILGLALGAAVLQLILCLAALPAGAKGTASFVTSASAAPDAPKESPVK